MTTEPRVHEFDATAGVGDTGIYGAEETATVYDSLVEALSAKTEKPPIVCKVPARPGVSVKFNPNIDFDLYQMWVDKARKAGKKKDGNPDYLKLALTVISNTNICLVFKGEDATIPGSGELLDVRRSQFIQMMGVPANAVGAAIRKLYGGDGDIINTMHRIIKEAGYTLDDEDIDEEDGDPLGI